MAKKRKLNSNNPMYSKVDSNEPKVLEKKLMCNAQVRDASGNAIEGKTIPVYGVWYENDKIKAVKEEKWWKLSGVKLN
tara:strand:+ start:118 stop:351 length:234 start_codon:yes stop_codon:yes gene_type:complete